MFASTINLTIFIMMILIYLNELKNVSMFVFNFNYIKDLSKIIMEQKCNNIYCEAETDRYQIAKNSYKLLLPNDIFNSKTYTIMVFIISIMIYIYYYYLLFDSTESNKLYFVLHSILFTILISMIILRYVPHDEAGYLNYFKDFNDPENSFATFITSFNYFIWVSMGLIPIIIIVIKNNSLFMTWEVAIPLVMKILCYMLSLVLIFNLMNIVMSFRTNTKPILKTKTLTWSLKKSFEKLYDDFTEGERVVLDTDIAEEWKIFLDLKNKFLVMYGSTTNEQKISYIINIFIAFNELAKITLKGFTITDKDINSNYIKDLKNTINKNNVMLVADATSNKNTTDVSNVSLLYDKTVKIPFTYDDENTSNANKNNKDYIYTADISYDSPNLFYEKYWDVNFGSMWKYDYFVPTILFGGYKPNLYKILMMIITIIVFIFIIYNIAIYAKIEGLDLGSLYIILQPLIMFVFLIGFILLFVNFNTWFNKYVVYMCLDSSYKRSLNKLNNIVTPYIRMYDNKIIRGNKTYIRHYIIANVFYSILSGNIKLNDGGDLDKPVATVPQVDLTIPFIAKTRIANIQIMYDEATKANEDISSLLTNLNIGLNTDNIGNIINYAKKAFGTANSASKTALTAITSSYEDICWYIITLYAVIDDINKTISQITADVVSGNFYAIEILVDEAVIKAGKALPTVRNADIPISLEIINKLDVVKKAKESVDNLKSELNAVKPNGSKAGLNVEEKKYTLTESGKKAKDAVQYAKNLFIKGYDLQLTSSSSANDYRVALYKAVNNIIIGKDPTNGSLTRSYLGSEQSLILEAVNGETISGELIKSKLETGTATEVKAIIKTAYDLTKEAKKLSDNALRSAKLAKDAVNDIDQNSPDYSPLAPIDEDTRDTKEAKEAKYYDISRIKENRLKFTNINNSILSNDNEYREYYKALYNNIYQDTYNETRAENLYKVFKDIFTKPTGTADNITTVEGIDAYFKNHIITKGAAGAVGGTVNKIYLIIKKCIDLFDEEKFNNNLIYYNNPENKQKGIDIDSYAKFKFYKYGDNVIPYKFILNLNTTTEYDNFVKDIKDTTNAEFEINLIDYFDISAPSAGETPDITKILEDNDEEDLLSQASDIEKKQDKNLIKIIAKYLLILGHINYNRIEYFSSGSDAVKKQDIYERKSYHLYKLISNILYDETYDIDDTFKTSLAPALLITKTKYYNLTYIYNYLETKYVVISPNSNKNYLINIIKSINNNINDDDKTLNTEAKNARYLFRDKINNKNNPKEYENEEDILTIANNISTSSLIATYVCNIIVLTLYFIIISINVKKSF